MKVPTKLYDLLGVVPSATKVQIKHAFKALALRWHPDKIKSSNIAERKHAADKFNQIRQAYEVLTHPDLRKKYDRGEAVTSRPTD